jgi:probable phosphoglycerate mutase
MKKIYIIRHGQTEYNRQGVLQGRRIDAPLNRAGELQSEAFYRKYANTGFDLLLTSELKRSIQSVGHFRKNGIPHRIDERITEFSWGENEGMPLSDLVIDKYQAMLESWYAGKMDARIPGRESGRELWQRVNSFAADLRKLKEENILICTHGRTLKMLVVVLMGWEIRDMERVRHSNSALYQLNSKDETFQMIRENDLSHLPENLRQDAYWDK